MAKITMIGAGSMYFSHRIMADCFTYPSMEDAEICLMDISEEALDFSYRYAQRTVKEGNYSKVRVTKTTDRRKALEGADFVIIFIRCGGWQPVHIEVDIPLKYGVAQTVADTTGPGGVFRMLRTAPHIVSMAQDIMEICPDALVLNYTNPMSMLTWAAYRAEPQIQWIGLCHSVQGTSYEWAERIGVPKDEVNYVCAGINHLAWFLRFEHNGRDLLPAIREKAVEPEIWFGDTTRCEYVKHFGHPVTESSGHNSEYSWWFRKRPETLEKYCSTKGSPWNTTGFLKMFIKEGSWVENAEKTVTDPKPLDLKRSPEYASKIMNARLTNERCVIHGNLPNNGLISNLPPECMVEVPVVVDKNGYQPMQVGALPPQLAALDQANINVHKMAVEGFFSQDPEMIFHAIAYDPLTSAVCSLDEIREMVAEMFEADAPYMPELDMRLERKPQVWQQITPEMKGEKHQDPTIDA